MVWLFYLISIWKQTKLSQRRTRRATWNNFFILLIFTFFFIEKNRWTSSQQSFNKRLIFVHHRVRPWHKFSLVGFVKLAKPVMTRTENPTDLHGCRKIFWSKPKNNSRLPANFAWESSKEFRWKRGKIRVESTIIMAQVLRKFSR